MDDNRDAADSLAMLLELGGHQVTAVYSAPEALKRASELKPAVILLDIGLPEIDGCEVARRMRPAASQHVRSSLAALRNLRKSELSCTKLTFAVRFLFHRGPFHAVLANRARAFLSTG